MRRASDPYNPNMNLLKIKPCTSCCLALAATAIAVVAAEPEAPSPGANLAPLAQPSTSFVSGHESLAAINDGFDPRSVGDHSHGAYGNWPQTGTQWVQYDWSQPISTRRVDVYWWDDSQGVRLPKACRLLYWDGQAFVPVQGAKGFGVLGGHYNTTTFNEVTTPRLRLEFDGNGQFSTGIIEWNVYDSGNSPEFPPYPSWRERIAWWCWAEKPTWPDASRDSTPAGPSM